MFYETGEIPYAEFDLPHDFFEIVLEAADKYAYGNLGPELGSKFLTWDYCYGGPNDRRLQRFVDSLVKDGITKEGLQTLTTLCVKKLGEI